MKRFGSFGLDDSNQCLVEHGRQIALQPKPFAVLRYLVDHPGRLISHNELLDALWPETWVQPQVLRTHMLELRKVLGDDARRPRFIQSVPKRGYRFIAAVSDPDQAGGGMPSGSPADAAHSPGPRNAGLVNAGLVDRKEEMRLLSDLFEHAAAGQRQFVLVAGAAGIGKSALIDAFSRRVDSQARMARGQCVQGLGRKEEYYPVTEALRQLCAGHSGEELCAILARLAPGWSCALGLEPASQPSMDRAPGDLCAALEEFSRDTPLILLLEDLQWADEATLDLVSRLGRRRASARLMILCSCNTGHAAIQHALLHLKQDMIVRRLCTEIFLEPLCKADVHEMAASLLDHRALPPGLGDFVFRRSEGNPLFVLALVEHMIRNRILVRIPPKDPAQDGAAWEQRVPFAEVEAAVPVELARMIELEAQGLPPGEQRLLEAASLFEVAFPAWGVAAALEAEAADVEEACEALAARLMLIRRAGHDELPDGTRSAFYVFAHGIYREILYQRQAETRRARRHSLVAQRLAQLFRGREADVSMEIAEHYEAAGNWMRAIAALQSASDCARTRNAHGSAAALLEKALGIAANLADAERASVEREIRLRMAHMSNNPAGARRPAPASC